MTHDPDPIRCILPPEILERIARYGDEEQRERALRTLATDYSLRSIRAQNAILEAQAPKRLNPHVTEGGTRVRTILDCGNSQDPARARIVRTEDDPATGDVAADEAYDGLGATYGLFWDAYERGYRDGAAHEAELGRGIG